MKVNRILILSIIVFTWACKKEDDGSHSPKGASSAKEIEWIGDFDFGNIVCLTPDIIEANSTHLFIDGCSRIYRYNSDFVPVDWIGFDADGNFGIHDLSDQASAINGYLYLNGVNNTHAYIRHQYGGWADDSLIMIAFADGKTATIENEELEEYNFWVQSDGTIFRTDFDNANAQSIMKKFNANGDFIEEIPISGNLSFALSLIELDSDDNFYVVQGIQQADYTPPVISKFNSSFSKEMEFSTDLREQYVPHFDVSDEDIVYIADTYRGEFECYAYDRNGNLLNSYSVKNSNYQFFMNFVMNQKVLTRGNDGVWRIWSIPQ